MRVWVQFLCHDAEALIGAAIAGIPGRINGAHEVAVLVVDDGSADGTAEAARRAGADRVVRLPHSQGHARAFAVGLDHCLELGADAVVNLDVDSPSTPADVARLAQPVLDGAADIVIGHRVRTAHVHVPLLQRTLRAMGSRTVSVLAKLDVPDATSEVRAYSREAALKLNVFWKGAYTLDTLIQAAKKDLVVTHVPVAQAALEPRDRPRRSGPAYLKRSVATLLRAYALYEPLRTFVVIGGGVFVLGLAGLLRFAYFWLLGDGAGHVQSVTISGVLVIIGFQLGMLGILADVLSVNRQLTEDILLRLKREEMDQKTAVGVAASHSGSSRD